MYLTTDDLRTFLDEREIAALKRDYEVDGGDKLPTGITYAQNYVRDRIGARYDLAAEYALTGSNRSTTLMEIIAHIAIWKLAAVFPTIQLDGKRHYNYEEAKRDLERIAAGKLQVTIPLIENTTVGEVVHGTSTNFDVIY